MQRQKNLGITIPGDGEYGKAMSNAVDYGAWWTYSFQRTSGLELTDFNPITAEPIRSEPGNIRLTSFADRRDWTRFAAAYSDPESGIQLGRNATAFPTATGPISYTGHEALAADIANLRTGLAAADLPTGFITALSPGSASRIGNEYASEEEFIYARADVLREESKAIVDAGLTVQIDGERYAMSYGNASGRGKATEAFAKSYCVGKGLQTRSASSIHRTTIGNTVYLARTGQNARFTC